MAINPDGTQTFFEIPQQTYNQCLEVIQAAQAAWTQLVAEFAAENIATGISSYPTTIAAVANALQIVAQYGNDGSLWMAYGALAQVVVTPEMAPWLTQARIAWMQNRLISVIATL